MKTIGLLGGMSWESSIEYERIIHQEVRRRLGGTHSARTLHWTFDFHEIEKLQDDGDWEGAAWAMTEAAQALETAGAELLAICTNTMHKVAPAVRAAISIPLIHIADPTGAAATADGITKVGLVGTAYTMEQDFYRGHLERHHGLDVRIPGTAARAEIHRIIYEELVRGIVSDASRATYLEAIGQLVDGGAEGIIAGCTEIELLVRPEDLEVPLYPTARLHALATVDAALS